MAGPKDLAASLLDRASDDDAAIRALLDVESVTNSIVGFHAQQAVEKSLKAVMAWHEVDFPFVHDLAQLIELCQSAGLTLPAGLASADRLTPYAARLRYGFETEADVTRAEAASWAAEAVAWARGVVHERPPLE